MVWDFVVLHPAMCGGHPAGYDAPRTLVFTLSKTHGPIFPAPCVLPAPDPTLVTLCGGAEVADNEKHVASRHSFISIIIIFSFYLMTSLHAWGKQRGGCSLLEG